MEPWMQYLLAICLVIQTLAAVVNMGKGQAKCDRCDTIYRWANFGSFATGFIRGLLKEDGKNARHDHGAAGARKD